ncbi:hypothetical protein HA42_18875 [Pantoea deleyi]|nr:hypothetical protein HA42_18875 [Pantoea deleyi]
MITFHVENLIKDTVELIYQTECEADEQLSEAGIQRDYVSQQVFTFNFYEHVSKILTKSADKV